MQDDRRNASSPGPDDAVAPEVAASEPGETQGGPRAHRTTAPRYVFDVPVELEFGRETGAGRIHDISPTGARIESADLRLSEGAKVRLRFRFFDDAPAIDVRGHVVRTTETGGFCVQYDRLDPRIRRALATLLPKVGTGRWRDANETRYTGRLSTPLPPELHRACAEAAAGAGLSLDAWVLRCLEQATQTR